MTIRVLHVVGKMDRGGMETLIMNYYRNIDRNKIQFDFLVHYSDRGAYDDEIENLGGRIFRMPNTKFRHTLKYIRELKKFFEKHREYTVIHGHLESASFIYNKISKEIGNIHTILHAHNTSVERNLTGLMRFLLIKLGKRNADSYFACSRAAGEFYFGKHALNSNEVVILPNAINVEEFSFNKQIRREIRAELDIEDKFVIGHVGRFYKQKNHSFLIDILKETLEKNPNTVLLLIGGGPLEDTISEKVKRLNLSHAVKFLGVRTDINNLLQGMDVFLLPSLYEGLPVVAVEAQASGVRMILSEGVPAETQVTGAVEFISLKKSAAFWAEEVNKWSNNYQRENYLELMTNRNYNVKTNTKKLEEFYLERHK